MQTRSQTRQINSTILSACNSTVSTPRLGTITRSVAKTTMTHPPSPISTSQTNRNAPPVFDFDEASTEWLHNKTKQANGTYRYKNTDGIITRSGLVLCS